MALIVTSMLFRHGKLHNRNQEQSLVGIGTQTIRLNDVEKVPSYAYEECNMPLDAIAQQEREERIKTYSDRAAAKLPIFN